MVVHGNHTLTSWFVPLVVQETSVTQVEVKSQYAGPGVGDSVKWKKEMSEGS